MVRCPRRALARGRSESCAAARRFRRGRSRTLPSGHARLRGGGPAPRSGAHGSDAPRWRGHRAASAGRALGGARVVRRRVRELGSAPRRGRFMHPAWAATVGRRPHLPLRHAGDPRAGDRAALSRFAGRQPADRRTPKAHRSRRQRAHDGALRPTPHSTRDIGLRGTRPRGSRETDRPTARGSRTWPRCARRRVGGRALLRRRPSPYRARARAPSPPRGREHSGADRGRWATQVDRVCPGKRLIAARGIRGCGSGALSPRARRERDIR